MDNGLFRRDSRRQSDRVEGNTVLCKSADQYHTSLVAVESAIAIDTFILSGISEPTDQNQDVRLSNAMPKIMLAKTPRKGDYRGPNSGFTSPGDTGNVAIFLPLRSGLILSSWTA